MKTRLYSEIRKMKVNTPIEENAGKIIDILGHKSGKYWECKEVEIRSGLIKSEKNYFEVEDFDNVEKEWIEMDKGIEDGKDSYSTPIDISLSNMKGKKVITQDEEEVGVIYDYEIQVDSRPWKVWYILVRPGGISPTKRRKRVSMEDIKSVETEQVILGEEYD